MSRQVPWRRNCPDVVSHRIEQANQARIFLLRETGPTGFLLKEDGVDKKFKVFLGDLHSCTCNTFMKEKELCIHILWVLLKKFRIPKENAVIFQLSLVEREINEVIRGAFVPQGQPTKYCHTDGRNKLKPKDITEDDICPICQDELLCKSGEPLTYCKYGCGNSVHLKCMKIYAEHQRSTGEKIMKCPLCRVDFGSFQDLLDEFNKSSRKKTRAERQDVHLGATCHKCRMCPISGKCYRCVICVDYHLCHECFSTDHHTQHSFQFRQNSSQRWRHASRVTPLPNAVMDNLQNRDITETDYDLLLQLDRPVEEHEGVAGHVLSSIPVEILREQHPLLSQDKNCGICLHGYQAYQSIRKLHCRHIFHRDCIDNWLSNHSTCPVDGASVTSRLANEWSGSNEISPPVIGRDKNNRVLTQRQRLLVKRREGVKKQEQQSKSLPSNFSLSGLGILVCDRSRENSPGEDRNVRRLPANYIVSPPTGLQNKNTATRDHVIFNPDAGNKPPLAPTSVERGSRVKSDYSKRTRRIISENRRIEKRNSLASNQRSNSLDNLTVNATGLVVSDNILRHRSSKKGQLMRGKLAAQTSHSDPEIFATNEPLVASGLAIHLPSTEDF